jgi:hypothetical protein
LKKQIIWTKETNEYISIYNNEIDIDMKNKIFINHLMVPITTLINIVINKLHIKQYNDDGYIDDIIQECLLFILSNVLDKITDDRVITSQHYIYMSLYNKVISLNKKNNKIKYTYDVKDYNDYYSDIPSKQLDDRIDIINGLNKKIRNERIINRRNTIFLLLLKDYLIMNDFDAREFNIYCMDKMSINLPSFNLIATQLKISTRPLNEKFIKNIKGDGDVDYQ